MISKQWRPRPWSSRGAHEPRDIVPAVFAPIHLARVEHDIVYLLTTRCKKFPNILGIGIDGTPVEIGDKGGRRGEALRFNYQDPKLMQIR